MNSLDLSRIKKPFWIGFVGCALLALGCGQSGGEPVEGTVTLDGAPLSQASLVLTPKDPQVRAAFAGQTDADGRFTLQPVDESSDGISPGDYQLALSTSRSDGMENSVPTPERVPEGERVRDLQVPEGGLPDLKIELKSK